MWYGVPKGLITSQKHLFFLVSDYSNNAELHKPCADNVHAVQRFKILNTQVGTKGGQQKGMMMTHKILI